MLKNDSLIKSWKSTFIQYKARCEKRKIWKEKKSAIEDIEERLIKETEENATATIANLKETEQVAQAVVEIAATKVVAKQEVNTPQHAIIENVEKNYD